MFSNEEWKKKNSSKIIYNKFKSHNIANIISPYKSCSSLLKVPCVNKTQQIEKLNSSNIIIKTGYPVMETFVVQKKKIYI